MRFPRKKWGHLPHWHLNWAVPFVLTFGYLISMLIHSSTLSHFSMTKEYKSLLYVLKHLSFNKMAKFISFFILVLLLLLSAAESSRSLSANTHKVSSPVSEFTVYLSTDGGCSLHVLIFVFQLVNLAGGIRHQWWWMLFRIRKWRVLD